MDPRSGEIIKCDVAMGDSWVKAYLQDLELELVNFTRLAQKASNLRSALLEVDPSDLSMEQRQSRRMMEHIVNIVCQVVLSSAKQCQFGLMHCRFCFDATESLFQSLTLIHDCSSSYFDVYMF